MKKNITINLFGQLFNIDEDAYELLERYQASMRTYFSRVDGGDDIASDVEARVAELLSELKAQGVEAINIEHVSDIIKRIGNPSEMVEEATEDEPFGAGAAASTGCESTAQSDAGNASSGSSTSAGGGFTDASDAARKAWQALQGRRLYRDPNDHILGGVIAGLSKYFGLKDPTLLRLVFVLALFFSLSTIAIVYVVLWLVVPVAITPEQQLMMRGEPVTPEGISEELTRSTTSGGSVASSFTLRSSAESAFNVFLRILIIIGFVLLLILLFPLVVALIVMMIALIAVISFGSDIGLENNRYFFIFGTHTDVTVLGLIACVSGIIFLCLCIYGVIRSLRSSSAPALSSHSRWTLFIVSIVSFITLLVSGTIATARCTRYAIEAENARREKIKKENTRDGVYLTSDSWVRLDNDGWKVVTMQHIEPWLSDYENSPFADNEDLPTIHLQARDGQMNYELQKTMHLDAGTYDLTFLYSTNGNGHVLSVAAGDNATALKIALDPVGQGLTDVNDTTLLRILSDGSSASLADAESAAMWRVATARISTSGAADYVFTLSNTESRRNGTFSGAGLKISQFRVRKVQ